MRSTEISNSDDVIDSRDVIKRIEKLQCDVEAEFVETLPEGKKDDYTEDEFNEWLKREDNSCEADEYRSLIALQNEAEGDCDWTDGAALIRDSYFVDHLQQECEDCEYISEDLPSWIEIDWEKTAENVKVDYTEVDFDGVAYFVR